MNFHEVTEQLTFVISRTAEATAAVIIGFALIRLVFSYLRAFFNRETGSVSKKRNAFGSSVSLALELLLGADVLATAVAPSWDDIGKLAAIAIIRTTLNYFLEKELKSQEFQS